MTSNVIISIITNVMNRRGFLRGLVGGVAVATTTAIAPEWPFRVYSFAKSIIPVGLSATKLQAVYNNIVFGYDEPDLIYTTADVMNELTAKYIIPELSDEIFEPSPMFLDLINKDKYEPLQYPR